MTKPSIFLFLLFSVCLSGSFGHAQSWSLENCIEVALANHPSMKNGYLEQEVAEYNLKMRRSAMLPVFSSGATHGYNWGQTIDLFTNQFATNRVGYDNFFLSGSTVLFSGLQAYRAIQIGQLDLQNSQLQMEVIERTIRIEVGTAYYQVLLNREIATLYRENETQSVRLLDAKITSFEHGQATAADTLELQAQLAKDQYMRIKAENDLSYALLLLRQLMNVSDTLQLEAKSLMPEAKGFLPTGIPAFPELDQIQLKQVKQLQLIRTAKGRYYPSLSLNGALGSGYSENNKVVLANGTLVPKSFSNQLRSNFYQSAYVTISIPLFSRNSNRYQVKMLELQSIELENEKKAKEIELHQHIEQLRQSIVNLRLEADALEATVNLTQLRIQQANAQVELGAISLINWEQIRNQSLQVQSQLLQLQFRVQLQRFLLSCYF